MDDIKRLVAGILLDINAVHFNAEQPFIFTSKTVSPVYVDCRKLISFPAQRRKVIKMAQQLIENEMSGIRIDVIAGGETAGIPYAAWLSDNMELPMIYIRKKPKGFGRLAQIEGDLKEGDNVLLVEDLLFDALSKLNFCEAIRQGGGNVDHTLVIFDYAISKSRDNLDKHKIILHKLTDWPMLLLVGQQRGHFSKKQAGIIYDFLENPTIWRAKFS